MGRPSASSSAFFSVTWTAQTRACSDSIFLPPNWDSFLKLTDLIKHFSLFQSQMAGVFNVRYAFLLKNFFSTCPMILVYPFSPNLMPPSLPRLPLTTLWLYPCDLFSPKKEVYLQKSCPPSPPAVLPFTVPSTE